jgi:sugar (pentulose or hexulose) kinase
MTKGLSPVMVLPHFNGSGTPVCDLSSRGAIVGLSMATTRHDIAKAILESLCFELRLNCQTLRETGLRHDELVAVGGGARSHAWLQLKSDILGCPIRTLAVREAACLGAGLLAGVACRMYGSIDEAVSATVKTSHLYEPNRELGRAYDERYAVYQKLYPALKTLNRKL